MKAKKTARIRNRYNQVPHLFQDTKWESHKIIINITTRAKRSALSGDRKAEMNRRESMTNTILSYQGLRFFILSKGRHDETYADEDGQTQDLNNTNDPQMIHK